MTFTLARLTMPSDEHGNVYHRPELDERTERERLAHFISQCINGETLPYDRWLAQMREVQAALLTERTERDKYCTYCGERIADNEHSLRLGAHLPCISLHVGLWPKPKHERDEGHYAQGYADGCRATHKSYLRDAGIEPTERTGERDACDEDGIFRRGYHIGYADGRSDNPEDADWHLAVEGPAPEPDRGERLSKPAGAAYTEAGGSDPCESAKGARGQFPPRNDADAATSATDSAGDAAKATPRPSSAPDATGRRGTSASPGTSPSTTEAGKAEPERGEGALLPCPFCGGDARKYERQDEDLWSHNEVTWTSVGCADCDVEFSWPPGAEPTAVEQWNTRVTSPEPAEREPCGYTSPHSQRAFMADPEGALLPVFKEPGTQGATVPVYFATPPAPAGERRSPFTDHAADVLAIAVNRAIEGGFIQTRTEVSDALEQWAMCRFDCSDGNEIRRLRELAAEKGLRDGMPHGQRHCAPQDATGFCPHCGNGVLQPHSEGCPDAPQDATGEGS